MKLPAFFVLFLVQILVPLTASRFSHNATYSSSLDSRMPVFKSSGPGELVSLTLGPSFIRELGRLFIEALPMFQGQEFQVNSSKVDFVRINSVRIGDDVDSASVFKMDWDKMRVELRNVSIDCLFQYKPAKSLKRWAFLRMIALSRRFVPHYLQSVYTWHANRSLHIHMWDLNMRFDVEFENATAPSCMTSPYGTPSMIRLSKSYQILSVNGRSAESDSFMFKRIRSAIDEPISLLLNKFDSKLNKSVKKKWNKISEKLSILLRRFLGEKLGSDLMVHPPNLFVHKGHLIVILLSPRYHPVQAGSPNLETLKRAAEAMDGKGPGHRLKSKLRQRFRRILDVFTRMWARIISWTRYFRGRPSRVNSPLYLSEEDDDTSSEEIRLEPPGLPTYWYRGWAPSADNQFVKIVSGVYSKDFTRCAENRSTYYYFSSADLDTAIRNSIQNKAGDSRPTSFQIRVGQVVFDQLSTILSVAVNNMYKPLNLEKEYIIPPQLSITEESSDERRQAEAELREMEDSHRHQARRSRSKQKKPLASLEARPTTVELLRINFARPQRLFTIRQEAVAITVRGLSIHARIRMPARRALLFQLTKSAVPNWLHIASFKNMVEINAQEVSFDALVKRDDDAAIADSGSWGWHPRLADFRLIAIEGEQFHNDDAILSEVINYAFKQILSYVIGKTYEKTVDRFNILTHAFNKALTSEFRKANVTYTPINPLGPHLTFAPGQVIFSSGGFDRGLEYNPVHPRAGIVEEAKQLWKEVKESIRKKTWPIVEGGSKAERWRQRREHWKRTFKRALARGNEAIRRWIAKAKAILSRLRRRNSSKGKMVEGPEEWFDAESEIEISHDTTQSSRSSSI